MVFGNLDNLLLGEVGLHRRVLSPLANDIGLISLLPVHRETVLVTVDRDSLEGELVGSTEDTDWDFTSVGDEDLVQLHDGAVGSQASVDGVGMLVSVAVGVRRAELVAAAVLSHGGQRGQLLSLLLSAALADAREEELELLSRRRESRAGRSSSRDSCERKGWWVLGGKSGDISREGSGILLWSCLLLFPAHARDWQREL